MTSSIGEADIRRTHGHTRIRQTRKCMTHTGCIFYSTLLIRSAPSLTLVASIIRNNSSALLIHSQARLLLASSSSHIVFTIIPHTLTTALVTHFAPRLYALTLPDYCHAATTPSIDIISIDTAKTYLNCKTPQ